MQKRFLDRWVELCNRDDVIEIKESLVNANFACFIVDYEEAIEQFVKEKYVLLGGDIFFKNKNIYNFDGSSWYYNGDSIEDSAKKAREYLSKLSHQKDIIVTFIIKSA